MRIWARPLSTAVPPLVLKPQEPLHSFKSVLHSLKVPGRLHGNNVFTVREFVVPGGSNIVLNITYTNMVRIVAQIFMCIINYLCLLVWMQRQEVDKWVSQQLQDAGAASPVVFGLDLEWRANQLCMNI